MILRRVGMVMGPSGNSDGDSVHGGVDDGDSVHVV